MNTGIGMALRKRLDPASHGPYLFYVFYLAYLVVTRDGWMEVVMMDERHLRNTNTGLKSSSNWRDISHNNGEGWAPGKKKRGKPKTKKCNV